MMQKFLFLIGITSLMATEELPWIEPALTPILSIDSRYQHFRQLDSGKEHINYMGNTLLLDGSLFFALSSSFSLELEAGITKTKAHALMGNAYKQTARYLFFDDTQGDLLSLVSGISLIEPYKRALHDVSLIHHGYIELEGFLSFGKEWIDESIWTSRLSSLIKGGVANQGSPWLRSSFVFQKAFQEAHVFKVACDLEGGFGKKKLHKRHFHGYGNVAYRLIDLSLGYTYQCDNGSEILFEILQRVYTKNAPYAVSEIRLDLICPFRF